MFYGPSLTQLLTELDAVFNLSELILTEAISDQHSRPSRDRTRALSAERRMQYTLSYWPAHLLTETITETKCFLLFFSELTSCYFNASRKVYDNTFTEGREVHYIYFPTRHPVAVFHCLNDFP